MPSSINGNDVIALARLSAEIPSGITDANILLWANMGVKRLTGKIFDANPKWGLKSDTVAVDGSSETYNLPSDTYKVRQVFIDATKIRLYPIDISERSKYADSSLQGIAQPAYYLVGSSEIGILPVGWVGTLRVFYNEVPIALTDGTDPTAPEFNGVMGWEDWIVSYIGMQYARRIAEDITPWMADMDRIWADIRRQAMTVNAGNGLRCRNIEGEALEEELLRTRNEQDPLSSGVYVEGLFCIHWRYRRCRHSAWGDNRYAPTNNRRRHRG